LRMNKLVGDRGASANDLATDHSPDHGFCESQISRGLTPILSGKALNTIAKKLFSNFSAKAAEQYGSASPS